MKTEAETSTPALTAEQVAHLLAVMNQTYAIQTGRDTSPSARPISEHHYRADATTSAATSEKTK